MARATTGSGDFELPEHVWARIEEAPARLLMLDYDGTLAPFDRDRMAARPPAEALEALRLLARSRHTRVAIVSGRPMDELVRLTDGLDVHRVAEHGWQERMPNGLVISHQPGGWARWRLRLAQRAARDRGLEERAEIKDTAIVLHLRGVEDPDELRRAARLAGFWRLLALGGGLTVDRIAGGFEIRARGRGKGTAVRELLRAAPPGTLGVYLGDDVTDEDAFRALRERGITIHVGAGERPTHAEWRLESPAAVARFLSRWAGRNGEAA